MRKYYDGQPDPQPTTTSAGTSEREPLPVRSESAGWVSKLSEKELRMLKKGLKQLKYVGLEAMTTQIELERKLVKELSRRKKPNVTDDLQETGEK